MNMAISKARSIIDRRVASGKDSAASGAREVPACREGTWQLQRAGLQKVASYCPQVLVLFTSVERTRKASDEIYWIPGWLD
jgi:hypothetical protein